MPVAYFYFAKMKEDERILAYIARVRQLASDLKSMSVDIDDAEISMTVLSGLPDRFQNLIVATDETNEDNLILDFLKSQLIQEEQRLSERTPKNTYSVDPALTTYRRQSTKGGKFCNYCRMRNHIERYCYKKRDDLAASNHATKNNSTSHEERLVEGKQEWC